VNGMAIGDTMATSCQAMKVNSKRECFLHPTFSVFGSAEEYRSLLITRTTEGYVVDTTLVANPDWEPEETFERYGIPEDEWIPVVRLIH
jgi:hypothetical protein